MVYFPGYVVYYVECVGGVAEALVDGAEVVVRFKQQQEFSLHLVQNVDDVATMFGGEGVGLGLVLFGYCFGAEARLGLVGVFGIHDVVVSTTYDHGAEELVKVGAEFFGGFLYLSFILSEEASP